MADGYSPMIPARRPGGRPGRRPEYRVLVHRKYADMWEHAEEYGVELPALQKCWDHLAFDPAGTKGVVKTKFLHGKAGRPKERGFSRTLHYDLSGKARIDYQYCDDHRTGADGDPHKVVYIWTVDFSSH